VTEHIVDTNILLFFLQGDRRLSRGVLSCIESVTNRSLVSMASLWEISIKSSLGKLRFDYASDPELPERLKDAGFALLEIRWETIVRAGELPWLHRDPFDRIILAECMLHNIPVLSTDRRFDAYGVHRIE
jgi:PIN domain nuclease of toxin-antitoxin system